jgi:hypothetical protein
MGEGVDLDKLNRDFDQSSICKGFDPMEYVCVAVNVDK